MSRWPLLQSQQCARIIPSLACCASSTFSVLRVECARKTVQNKCHARRQESQKSCQTERASEEVGGKIKAKPSLSKRHTATSSERVSERGTKARLTMRSEAGTRQLSSPSPLACSLLFFKANIFRLSLVGLLCSLLVCLSVLRLFRSSYLPSLERSLA